MIEIICKSKEDANALFSRLHWVNMDMKVTVSLDSEGYHFEIEELDS